MSPDEKGGGADQGDEQPRADDTQEHELGDDFREDTGDEEVDQDEVEEEDLDDDDLEEEDYDEGDEEDLGEHEDELQEVVSAETQEWDGLEAAEAEGEAEKTVVASTGERVKHAHSSITSGFEKVSHSAGPKITSGFKAVRRHVRFPMWLRFLTASLVIIASIAGATSASLILYLSDIANALKHGSILNGVQPFLKTPGSGPQTILILGSDKRNQEISGKFGLSDTTMLLRLDPDRNAIALLSLPRDLKVDIPGYGTDKLNAAYSLGGPKLTLQTVKQLTGVDVNHLVNVDFTGFARAVNAIGCVYVDVDHRYYHKNSPYAPSIDDYAEINLQPGYQALCGFDALAFVRYRHTDNDIVRAARQQAFLREARAKVPPEKLFEDRSKLVKIFTHYTSSDINSAEQMLQVLRLFFDLRGAQIKEIHFNGTLGPSYVTATPDEIHTAVNQFLGIESTPGPAGSSAKPSKAVAPEQAPDATKPTAGLQEALGLVRIDHPHPHELRKAARGRNQAAQGEGPGLLSRRSSRPGATMRRSHASTRSTARATSRRHTTSERPTSGSSRCRRSATTTGSRGRDGRTRRSSTTRAMRRRSAGATTSSSTTATASGWSPGRPTRARSGSPTPSSRPFRTRTCSRSPRDSASSRGPERGGSERT